MEYFKAQLTPKSFFCLTYSPYWPGHLCEKIVAVAFFIFFFFHEFSNLENFALL